MRAIIWKELRETIRWAIPGMLIIGLTMAYILMENARGGHSIASRDFFDTMAIICPIFGAAIGFMQVIFESRQGYWALLTHRPMSRRKIFLGKSITGLSLYGLATLIPFLIAAIWSSIPGNVAGPFRWGMAVPGLITIATGTAYYFAGSIVGTRPARWYASRCLPLLGPVACSFLVMEQLYEAWAALLAIIITTTLMFAAAYGSFTAGGEFKTQNGFAKTSLGAAMLIGICITGGLVIALAMAFLPYPPYNSHASRLVYHQVLSDGRIVMIENIDGKRVSVKDMQGNPLPELLETVDGTDTFGKLMPVRVGLTLTPQTPQRIKYRNYYREMQMHQKSDPMAIWFYLADTGRIVGYDRESRRYIGSLGPDGFAKPGQDTTDRFIGKPFDYSMYRWEQDYFVVSNGAYKVDLTNRTVTPMFLPRDEASILSFSPIAKPRHEGIYDHDDDLKVDGYAIFAGGLAYMMDADWQVKATLTPTLTPPGYPGVAISILDEQGTYALAHHPSWQHFGDQAFDMPYQVVIKGAGDQVISTTEIPPRVFEYSQTTPWITALGSLVSPPGPLIGRYVIEEIRYPFLKSYRRQHHPGMGAPWNIGMLIAASVCLVINFRLARRNAMNRDATILWSTLGLLLGISGVFLMLCLQAWPARLSCDRCGKPRLVTLFDCEHCGAAFAPPPSDGTEIFN